MIYSDVIFFKKNLQTEILSRESFPDPLYSD